MRIHAYIVGRCRKIFRQNTCWLVAMRISNRNVVEFECLLRSQPGGQATNKFLVAKSMQFNSETSHFILQIGKGSRCQRWDVSSVHPLQNFGC